MRQGVYSSFAGMNVVELKNNNFPKEFFYGRYKMTIKLKSEKNEFLGCVVFEINIVRPWE